MSRGSSPNSTCWVTQVSIPSRKGREGRALLGKGHRAEGRALLGKGLRSQPGGAQPGQAEPGSGHGTSSS